jgi:hypothetical protein
MSRIAWKTCRIAMFTGQIITDLTPPVTGPVRLPPILEVLLTLPTVALPGDLLIEGQFLLHLRQGGSNPPILGDMDMETIPAETCEFQSPIPPFALIQ